jgi:hypothetical protein
VENEREPSDRVGRMGGETSKHGNGVGEESKKTGKTVPEAIGYGCHRRERGRDVKWVHQRGQFRQENNARNLRQVAPQVPQVPTCHRGFQLFSILYT